MIHDALFRLINAEFPFEPTDQQAAAMLALARFVTSTQRGGAFVLRGYAGTGKTSLVAALVRALKRIACPTVLLAPTGRAAKVFSRYAGTAAFTIHKAIYRQETFEGEHTRFALGFNKLRGAVFIVDEASMISGRPAPGSVFGSGCLLDDLVRYVGEGDGCRLIFVGDTAQLPPVGEEVSPALDAGALARFGLRATGVELSEVVRQAEASGVLWNATRLRRLVGSGAAGYPCIRTEGFDDVRLVPGGELIEELVGAYGYGGTDETTVVTRSNRRAVIYNNGIRARIFDREGELTRGDWVMAVKNNYYWTEQAAAALPEGERLPFDFVANGDVAEVRRLRNIHEMHGFRFADATLRFPDYDDYELTLRVVLDTLQSEAPALTAEERDRLFEAVAADYTHVRNRRERMKLLRLDPYYNALQIKYAYAITCHKAQGGQWSRVFVDQGYLGDAPADDAYLRWLYTAFTRTSDRLYLVNWPPAQTETAPPGQS